MESKWPDFIGADDATDETPDVTSIYKNMPNSLQTGRRHSIRMVRFAATVFSGGLPTSRVKEKYTSSLITPYPAGKIQRHIYKVMDIGLWQGGRKAEESTRRMDFLEKVSI
jgi:hypothetical protein